MLLNLWKDLASHRLSFGGLSEGGLLVQARGNVWGRLIFQDLIKLNN